MEILQGALLHVDRSDYQLFIGCFESGAPFNVQKINMRVYVGPAMNHTHHWSNEVVQIIGILHSI